MKYIIFLLLISLQLVCTNTQNKNITSKRIDSLMSKLEQSEDVAKSKIIYTEIQQLAVSTSDRESSLKSKKILTRILYNYAKDYTASLDLVKDLKPDDFGYMKPIDACSIFFTKSLCYRDLGLYEESLQELEKMLLFMKKITNDNDYHAVRYNYFFNKSAVFQVTQKTLDSAILFSREAFEIQTQIPKSHAYFAKTMNAGAGLGELYLRNKQLDSAQKYIDYSYELMLDPNLTIPISNKGFIMRRKGQLLLAQLKYAEASVFFHETINLGTNNSTDLKRTSYYYLVEAYKGLKDFDKENYYLKRYTYLTDSLNAQTLNQIKKPIMDLNIKNLEAEEKPYKYMWPLHTAILTIIASIAFLLYRKLNKKQETLPLSIQKILVIDKQPSAPAIDMGLVIELAKRHDVTFFKNFYELEPTFMHNLLCIAPDLSSSDLEFCAYLRLNFSTKEIARFTNLSIKSVQSKKYRLRKRLNIKTEQDINIWMSTLQAM